MKSIQGLLAELASQDDDRAEAAVAGLLVFSSEAVVVLRSLAASPQADTRWWALRALAEFSDPQIPLILITALKDEDPAVRQCAALGLRLQADPHAIPALIAALDDSDPLYASLACDALQATGPSAVPALLEVVNNGSNTARLLAVRALAHIGDERSIPVLFNALNEDSALMEYWANQGLERMGVGMLFFTP